MVVSSTSRRINAQISAQNKNLPGTPKRRVESQNIPSPQSKSPFLNLSVQKPFQPRNSRTTLRPMPNRIAVPTWLRLLKKTEKVSLTLAFVLVGGAVATYGWAVYSQQQWGKNFSDLNVLRRNERQLLKSSELMKNDIARHSDPKKYGLVPRSSERIVVIPPAPLRPALPTRNLGPEPKDNPITPIGY